jgi:phospholipid/cholesterol/gamma-HCH transport system substrate-binding protein
MKRVQTDVAVGLFVLAAFAILMWGSVQIGALRGWVGAEGKRVVARFHDVSGLDPEAEILIAGVPIGRVESLELEDHLARVTLRIEKRSVEIPVDSVVGIRSRGLLGERVVEIVPGSSDVLVHDGGVLARTEEAADIDQLVNRLSQISDDVQQISATFRSVLGSAEGEESLRDILSNVRELTTDLRRIVSANEEGFERVVVNLESFSSDLALLTDEHRAALSELVKNFQGASQKLGEALDSLAGVAQRIERGEGSLGKLLYDDALYSDVDSALGEARAALREVRRAAEEAQEQVPATILITLFGTLF